MQFLSARWEHLLLANYIVDPDVLQSRVPEGTRLDTFEGDVYVSLVAFMFNRTRVLGLPIPFHTWFEEVNLRFYVVPDKDPTRRSVTFIKEIVPKTVIPWISNTLFHENYVAVPMGHRNEKRQHEYSWGHGLENRFSATVALDPAYPESGSIGEFITEHYWGYAKAPRYTLEYEVRHPQWHCQTVESYEMDVDFDAVYGREFAFLGDLKPSNVQYAVGSPVTVSFPRRLK